MPGLRVLLLVLQERQGDPRKRPAMMPMSTMAWTREREEVASNSSPGARKTAAARGSTAAPRQTWVSGAWGRLPDAERHAPGARAFGHNGDAGRQIQSGSGRSQGSQATADTISGRTNGA